MQRELEVLSEQYSQKCLENAHLAQALEAERQALRQCQRENQELNAHNQVRPREAKPHLHRGCLTKEQPHLSLQRLKSLVTSLNLWSSNWSSSGPCQGWGLLSSGSWAYPVMFIFISRALRIQCSSGNWGSLESQLAQMIEL